MPDIALVQLGYLCTLATVMTYTRSGTPDFSAPLSREELRVFTAIRGETSFDTVLTKTRLDPELVEDVMANLVARGLIVPSHHDRPQPPAPVPAAPLLIAPPPAAQLPDSPRTTIRWAEQYEAVKEFLRARVGGSEAEAYISQLQNCASEQAFVESTRSIARRLALIVDANVGKQLLALVGNS